LAADEMPYEASGTESRRWKLVGMEIRLSDGSTVVRELGHGV
jgi:hypothetical protein